MSEKLQRVCKISAKDIKNIENCVCGGLNAHLNHLCASSSVPNIYPTWPNVGKSQPQHPVTSTSFRSPADPTTDPFNAQQKLQRLCTCGIDFLICFFGLGGLKATKASLTFEAISRWSLPTLYKRQREGLCLTACNPLRGW